MTEKLILGNTQIMICDDCCNNMTKDENDSILSDIEKFAKTVLENVNKKSL